MWSIYSELGFEAESGAFFTLIARMIQELHIVYLKNLIWRMEYIIKSVMCTALGEF